MNEIPNEQERTENPAGGGRKILALVLGFVMLGLAAVVLLFGQDLFGSPQEPAGSAGQLEPLTAGTPVVVGQQDTTASAPSVGDPAPDFALANLEGETVRLQDFRGRPVLINFWATWCGPCIFEMPELQAAYEASPDGGLVILGLNRAEDRDTIRNFLARDIDVTLTFPILLDEEATTANRYAIVNMPTSVFVDAGGTVTAIHRGPLTQEQIDDYLAQS